MKQRQLTESACRAIREAANLALDAGDDTVEPLHLLWSLIGEESHASAILDRWGIRAETLNESCPLETSGEEDRRVASQMSDASPTADVAPLPHSPALQQVLREAEQQAASMGRHALIGSEHLLWGLAKVDSVVKQALNEAGVDAESLAEQLSEASGLTAEPLQVDLHLQVREPEQADRADTYRILDAADNRAREGVRVVEDFVRFTLDDAHLTGLLKQWRHDLSQVIAESGWSARLPSRDTPRDVGTGIAAPSETRRGSSLEVVRANFKRAEEAIRTLEEFGKLLSPETAERFERLRYRLYTLEKAVLGTHTGRLRLEGRSLYLLVTDALCRHGAEATIHDALAAGANVVQVREKSMTDRELIEHGRRVRRWTRENGGLLIMNDRADLAVLTDADGVHVGQQELTVREARRIVGPERLVGFSTHSLQQARQAVLDGADYIGVGPVFPSTTKQFETYAGLELVARVAAEITLPWFAIGGINAGNIGEVIQAGATRVAVGSAICDAEKPAEATRKLARALTERVE